MKTNLSDQQLNELLNFTYHHNVHTVVLSGNSLTEVALDALLNYMKLNDGIKNVYLAKNSINTLRGYTRDKIGMLRNGGVNLYI